MPDYSFETEAMRRGFSVVAGTDEAGRGPLCGSVCAAAVILREGTVVEGLDDSKKLTEKKRERLYEAIVSSALSFGIAYASVQEIDSLNILNASQLAMRRAVAALTVKPDLVLIDGNVSRGFDTPTQTIVKGDGISMSIAAASVLAKVSRDRLCAEWDREYPQYGIAVHKGYATKDHIAALLRYGPCPLYRKTFLTKILKGTEYESFLR